MSEPLSNRIRDRSRCARFRSSRRARPVARPVPEEAEIDRRGKAPPTSSVFPCRSGTTNAEEEKAMKDDLSEKVTRPWVPFREFIGNYTVPQK